ncbi:uncharacterized protein HD556DRAFT_1239104, partial [Suillus plorans]
MDSHVNGPVLRPGRSFSDVVRTRADTPQPGAEVVSAGAQSTEDTPSSYKTSLAPNSATKVLDNPFISLSESSDESEVDTPWKTVERSHRRSKKASAVGKKLSKVDLVREAEKLLTTEEKRRILERKQVEMNADSREQTMSSREEGPSQPKGKSVDPWNWGNANLEESEIDIEAQREALSTWAKTHQWAKGAQREEPVEDSDKENDPNIGDPIAEAVKATEERMMKLFEKQIQRLQQKLEKKEDLPTKKVKIKPPRKEKPKGTGRELRSTNPVKEMMEKTGSKPSKHGERSTPPAMDAVAQIAPKSYLGHAEESTSSLSSSSPESESLESSSSSSSETIDSSTSSETSDSSERSDSTAKKRRKRSKKRKSHKRKRSSRKSTLKPIPPTEYDGVEDSRVFHRFITEGTAYLEDGNVSRKCRVFTLSRFLKGKAHEFYLRQVSDSPSTWRVDEFFTELFNYCFPLDYSTKQRKKLYQCYQGDKRVRDYLSELNELWLMIGNVPEQDKVVKFWFWLNPSIQTELYKMRLNPEVSSLSKVQKTAEIIELANSTVGSRPCDDGSKGHKPSGEDKSGRTSKGTDKTTYPNQSSGSSKDQNGARHHGSKDKGRRDRSNPKDRRKEHFNEPKMSKEEHNKLMSEGRCFVCKETGHMSRQCPKKRTVLSTSRDRPPGVPSYAMHVD